MNINIKCPHCGTVVQVVSANGLESKTLTCPNPQCKQQSRTSECLPKLSLRTGDAIFQLHFGKQWVGRASANNDAEVQIPTLRAI